MTVPLFHMVVGAPEAVAPFSHATEVDGWVFVTGQMPTFPGEPERPLPDGIEAQTRRVMDNLRVVLQGLGLDLAHAVSARAYLTHFEQDYQPFNAVYASYFAAGPHAGAHLHRRDRAGQGRAGRSRSARPDARASSRTHR